MARLTDMMLNRVSLVDKGANGRLIAVMKAANVSRGTVRKDVPTFASLQASREIVTWLPEALVSLGEVIDAAIAGVPDDPTITPELRIQAVRGSAAQFSAELLDRVAAAIAGEATPTVDVVVKRSPGVWGGLM
jgi:hypothetical protein